MIINNNQIQRLRVTTDEVKLNHSRASGPVTTNSTNYVNNRTQYGLVRVILFFLFLILRFHLF